MEGVVTVVKGEGLNPFGLVVSKVLHSEATTGGLCKVDHALSEWTFIEGFAFCRCNFF